MTADINTTILTGVRELLLTFPDVAAAVGTRIRPHRGYEADGKQTQIILQIPDATQFNVLDPTGAEVNATLVVRVRGLDCSAVDALAEAVRSQNAAPSEGLDGFIGLAGDSYITGCERTGFSNGPVYDDDGDETDLFESTQVYDLWYYLNG